MKIEIESLLCEHGPAFAACADKLNLRCPETRSEAAEIVTQFGLGAYIGGKHVAIHRKLSPFGEVVGPRLAIITHDAPDWV